MVWTPDPDARVHRERMARAAVRIGEPVQPRVFQALVRVPREAFVPEAAGGAFEDRALAIGHGQTISAPHMVAIMCDLVDPRPGDRVLEVGTGSGYHAAVLAELVRPGGSVVSIEVVPELADRARRVLHETGYGVDVEVRTGDGAAGAPDRSPFQRVSVAAATPVVPPALLEQLAVGGRMVVPVGRRECVLTAFDRTERGLERSEHGACVFVPLTGSRGV